MTKDVNDINQKIKTMKSYYNTNRSQGVTLKESKRKARSQQEIIATYMAENPAKYESPETIKDKLFSERTPITSVRRAMSNLADEGILQKTNLMQKGSYGKRIHLWRYADEPEQMELF